MSHTVNTPDRLAAAVLIIHIVAMFCGFIILGPAFEFPDVLRYPAVERFAIFSENQSVIRPTYWVLTMTGITQILISILLYHVVRAQSQTAATLILPH